MREQQQRRESVRRIAVLVAIMVVGSASFDVAGAESSKSNSSDALSRALLSGRDLPGHWARYRPRATRFDACGLKPPRTPNPKEQSSTAWAQNPTDGPLFGERIELYSKGKGSVRLQELKGLPLPCEWDEFKTHWQASAEPPIGLGDDNWVYVIESQTGPKGFTYEVKFLRGDALVLFVLNVRQPDRALLEDLARRVWAKADTRLAHV